MRSKILLVATACIMLLASCQTKKSAISDLRALTQELQINSVNYTLNDWKDAGKRYYSVNKRISKHVGDYTNAEAQEIAEMNGQCVRSFTEGAVLKVGGALEVLRSFIDGLKR